LQAQDNRKARQAGAQSACEYIRRKHKEWPDMPPTTAATEFPYESASFLSILLLLLLLLPLCGHGADILGFRPFSMSLG